MQSSRRSSSMEKESMLQDPGNDEGRDLLACLRPITKALCVGIGLLILSRWQLRSYPLQDEGKTCVQYDAHIPNSSVQVQNVYDTLETAAYRNTSANLLANAVKIPSISYDDMGSVVDDSRWGVFDDLFRYLEISFPAVHSRLSLERVVPHGLIYTWKGTDSALKPIVLMAHQDVVPVESLDQWLHPPFSGHISKTYIYGRGASDCKNMLVGILESVENLLNANFTPARTILLSFGADEESKGISASKLSQHIEAIYGRDSIALILDEGSSFTNIYGQIFATPGVAEKGYLDAEITVTMPGGHSSVPPDHTAIGVLSEILVAIEKHPYEVRLLPENPFYGTLQCAAKYAPDFPQPWKRLVDHKKLRELAKLLAGVLPDRYLLATSAAETIVRGGVKVNALPESVTAVVNHRIALHESTKFVAGKLKTIIGPIAKKHRLALHAFDGASVQLNSIHISSSLDTLDPAPITPMDTPEWAILSGTIRAVFPSVYVAGLLSTGNTDTKSYWNLSKNIYRFEPSLHGSLEGDETNIHTVNERMSIDGHLELVRFFYQFIQNVQGKFAKRAP